MSEMFYYIGIIYVVNYLKTMYDSCTDFNEKMECSSIEELQQIQDNIKNQNISALNKGTTKGMFIASLGMLTMILCYWWIIYGYLYAPESKLFLAMIIISIAFALTTVFKALKIFIRANMMAEIRNGNFAGGMKNAIEEIKNPYHTAFNIINRFAKASIAIYIVYNHFFIIT